MTYRLTTIPTFDPADPGDIYDRMMWENGGFGRTFPEMAAFARYCATEEMDYRYQESTLFDTLTPADRGAFMRPMLAGATLLHNLNEALAS